MSLQTRESRTGSTGDDQVSAFAEIVIPPAIHATSDRPIVQFPAVLKKVHLPIQFQGDLYVASIVVVR
jgi:hypothetical protein